MEVLYGIMKHILLEDFILLELQHDYSPCMAVFSNPLSSVVLH